MPCPSCIGLFLGPQRKRDQHEGHGNIIIIMIKKTRVFCHLSGVYPNGYMAVGYFIFIFYLYPNEGVYPNERGSTQRVSLAVGYFIFIFYLYPNEGVYPNESTQRVYGGRLFVVSARTNKRHHHHRLLFITAGAHNDILPPRMRCLDEARSQKHTN